MVSSLLTFSHAPPECWGSMRTNDKAGRGVVDVLEKCDKSRHSVLHVARTGDKNPIHSLRGKACQVTKLSAGNLNCGTATPTADGRQ